MTKKAKKKSDRDLKIYVIGAPVKLEFRQPGHKNEDVTIDAETVAQLIASSIEQVLQDFIYSSQARIKKYSPIKKAPGRT